MYEMTFKESRLFIFYLFFFLLLFFFCLSLLHMLFYLFFFFFSKTCKYSSNVMVVSKWTSGKQINDFSDWAGTYSMVQDHQSPDKVHGKKDLMYKNMMMITSSQFCWEIIDIHHYMSLRYSAWWLDLHILWNDYHHRFS